MNWIIIKTTSQRESQVAGELERQGYTAYVPRIPMLKTVSRKTRKRAISYSLVWPRHVFALAPSDLPLDDIKHARGMLHNLDGEVFCIPPSQMIMFQSRVASMTADAMRRYNRADAKASKQQFKRLADLTADDVMRLLDQQQQQEAA